VQNLTFQDAEFDIFIADMSTDPKMLRNNWLLNRTLDHMYNEQHRNWLVYRIEGANQLAGYQAGLGFAEEKGYEFAIASDDDVAFKLGWVARAQATLSAHEEASTVAGITMLPWWPDKEQIADEEFTGKLEEDQHDYRHATRIPAWTEPRAYEQVYGAFIFRVQDYLDVGGFPQYLSPLGFRGEMIAQTATYFNGRKLLIDPLLQSYHYSADYGGLKPIWANKSYRDECLAHDQDIWRRFLRRRKPTVADPRL
jgi:hypothetical protein